MRYYQAYYTEAVEAERAHLPERDYEKFPGIYKKPPPLVIPDLTGYMVDREEFPVLVRAFLDAYNKKKDRWRKAIQRSCALDRSDKSHVERMAQEARDLGRAEELPDPRRARK